MRVGSSLRSSGGRVIKVKQAILHPAYDPSILENDVALLRLSESLNYTDGIQAIQLDCALPAPDNTSCVVSGWGISDDGNLPEKLREATVGVINKEECQRDYDADNWQLAENSFCAGLRTGVKDACNGDSVNLPSFNRFPRSSIFLLSGWTACGKQ